MAKLVGLSGSLRSGSFNTALLHAAAQLTPEGNELQVRTLHGIPLYDGDAEATEGIPSAVTNLKEVIAAADGLLLATPEYNNSLPGVAKNGIDWLTRPPADIERVFKGKPVAIIGATPGGFGTILSQNAWLPVFRYLGASMWFGGRLLLSHAQKAFDQDGSLTDEAAREQLRGFVEGFAAFARSPAS